MRISIKERLGTFQKVLLKAWKLILGDVSGPMLVASYRKDFFGNLWAPAMQEGMRETSYWTKGEVELFAAFTSRINSCDY